MKVTKAIITAAGFGSRFLPITKTFPKEMLPIIDKPILQYLIEECGDAGIEEVIVVVSETDVRTFEDYFYGRATHIRTLMIRQNKLDRWNKVEKIFDLPKITIVPQDERIPYGNGRPILSVKDLVVNEEAFAVLFGDDMVLSKVSCVKQLVDYYEKNKCDGVLGVEEVSRKEISKYGAVKLKDGSSNEVERVIEKPKAEEAPSTLASFGRFIFTNKLFDYLKSDSVGKDGEVWLQDASDALARNGKVLMSRIDGRWLTTGDPLNYLKASIETALFREEFKEDFEQYLKGRVKE